MNIYKTVMILLDREYYLCNFKVNKSYMFPLLILLLTLV